MHIGIDLDGVLADLNGQTVQGYNKLFPDKEPLKFEDLASWNYLVEKRGMSKKLQTKIFNKVWRDWKDLPTVENSLSTAAVILELKAKGHTISIITHRHPYTHSYVPKWLNSKGILYDNLLLVSNKTGIEKHQFVDLLVDDHPRVVEIADQYPNTFILLRNQPWNTHIETVDILNVYRIYSLTEVPNVVGKLVEKLKETYGNS